MAVKEIQISIKEAQEEVDPVKQKTKRGGENKKNKNKGVGTLHQSGFVFQRAVPTF